MDTPFTMFVTLSPRVACRLCVLPFVLLGGAAQAQNTQAPATVPGLEGYSLPAQPERPTPLQTPEPRIAPLPRPTPSPTPTATATPAPLPSPVTPPPARTRATPKPTSTPTPTAMPEARATPMATPSTSTTPIPVATPSHPTITPTPTPTPPIGAASPPQSSEQTAAALGWWPAGVGLAVVLAGLLFYRRRRRVLPQDAEPVVPPLPSPALEPRITPPPPPAPVVVPRPRIEIDLEVKRAGTNLLSAAVEYRLTLRNAGDADAHGVALDLRLFGVDPRLEPALAALFDAPLDRPVVARFDLAAGTTAALEGTAMAPREAMPPLPIQPAGQGRVLFVPVMAVNLHYAWTGGGGQSAASFVVGVDRGPDTKLAPFRLDGAPRMHDRVRLMPFTVSRSS